ncbi:hypothetical protein KA183_14675 [bacterium]|nr:hypothetical protein [bacterium]QQR57983.1 MAG: hypothetical protein IPG59_00410 [Candidatus Melainabacteria bacterium]
MGEATALIKKAVMTSVGATSSLDRIKGALNNAMQDVVKIGQDLVEELEEQGKVKTENAQSFLKNLQDEAGKKTETIEQKVTGTMSGSVKKVAKDVGLVTREEYEELLERLEAVETSLNITHEEGEDKAKRSKSKKSNNNAE